MVLISSEFAANPPFLFCHVNIFSPFSFQYNRKKRGFSETMWMYSSFLNFRSDVLAAWPSGKAGDRKSFTPSLDPGAA